MNLTSLLKDGPTKKVRRMNLSRPYAPCPSCKEDYVRVGVKHLRFREISVVKPSIIEVIVSKHKCTDESCDEGTYLLPIGHLAQVALDYTNRVVNTAVYLVVNQGLDVREACGYMGEKYHVPIPPKELRAWVEQKRTENNLN